MPSALSLCSPGMTCTGSFHETMPHENLDKGFYATSPALLKTSA